MLGTESSTTTSAKPTLISQKSKPISIPRNHSKNNFLDDYEDNNPNTNLTLNANFFNPAKSSPPDIWKSRLEDRIKNYCANTYISIEK